MKLTILLISFIFIGAHATRVKRGLSADEQKKFLDELNKDRKRVADEEGFPFEPVEYDASLEKEIVSGKKCLEDKTLLPLRLNDVAEQFRKHYTGAGIDEYFLAYFLPMHQKIGCSKEAKCTEVLENEKNDDVPQKFIGKTIEYSGMCTFGESDKRYDQIIRLKKAKTPSPNKYGDILGIHATSGTGSVFSLTISLFLVLYI